MKKYLPLTITALLLSDGCAPPPSPTVPSVPSLEYSKSMLGAAPIAKPVVSQHNAPDGKAQMRLASADGDSVVSNEVNPELPGVTLYRSSEQLTRDYQGPLDLGDPGTASSLWRESRGGSDMLRDDRAWESGDLLTIIVTESDQGSRQANTNNKSETTLGAALSHFFGLAELFGSSNDGTASKADPSNLIEGTSKMEFKGQGKTDRKNSLTAKISAMVAEVLPTGILRIEGKKIIAVNDEEQIMIISGLVRTRDVTSTNEIDSSKIANMRIDYYGKGTVDEATTPGWGTRLIKTVWPF